QTGLYQNRLMTCYMPLCFDVYAPARYVPEPIQAGAWRGHHVSTPTYLANLARYFKPPPAISPDYISA
ncbi:MAG: hypothetical protein VXX49_09625, partial [Pseudomonadota bacterium]|nr:hypothetical protein [Pseudomonadota bacterium]